MGDPNAGGRRPTALRRRSTLQSSRPRLERRCATLRARLDRKKTSPYVGSFRHSPPTSLGSLRASFGGGGSVSAYTFCRPFASSPLPPHRPVASSSFPGSALGGSWRARCSPHVGWFRHAPPANATRSQAHGTELEELLESLGVDASCGDFESTLSPSRPANVDGCLPGGNRDDRVIGATGSPRTHILAKLGSWFLFPLANDAASFLDAGDRKFFPTHEEDEHDDDGSSSSSSSCSSSCDEDDDDGSVALSDFDGPRPRNGAAPSPLLRGPAPDISLSEIAESYYAHQMIDRPAPRLDYVITQMDIARMARNASRHLDVQSILNLPTVTYRAPNRVVQAGGVGHRGGGIDSAAFSFVLVEQQKGADNDDLQEEEQDMCVICQQPYADGDKLRVLPCDHSFHVGCIDRWLSGCHSHNECFTSGCPTCKARACPPAPSSYSTNVAEAANDGSVPSWAFDRLGDALARSGASVGGR